MSNLKFYLIILMFNLKSALQHEIGKDSSRRVVAKMKNHYKELDKRKPKEKGIMGFHRMLLIVGLSLYRAMQEELGNKDDFIEIIHRILWRCRTRQLTGVIAFFVRRSKNPYDLYLKLLGPKNERFFPAHHGRKLKLN